MMMWINLLPWREEARVLQKRHFIQILCVSLLSMIILSLLLDFGVDFFVTHIQQQNVIIKQQLARLSIQVKSIQIVQKQTQQLTSRLQLINKVHMQNTQSAQLFDL